MRIILKEFSLIYFVLGVAGIPGHDGRPGMFSIINIIFYREQSASEHSISHKCGILALATM